MSVETMGGAFVPEMQVSEPLELDAAKLIQIADTAVKAARGWNGQEVGQKSAAADSGGEQRATCTEDDPDTCGSDCTEDVPDTCSDVSEEQCDVTENDTTCPKGTCDKNYC